MSIAAIGLAAVVTGTALLLFYKPSPKPGVALLLDLTEAEFPNAEVRARLKRMFLGQHNLRRIAVFTGRNS